MHLISALYLSVQDNTLSSTLSSMLNVRCPPKHSSTAFTETQPSALFFLCLVPYVAYYILIVWLIHAFSPHSKAINSLMNINFVVKEQSAILRLWLRCQTDASSNNSIRQLKIFTKNASQLPKFSEKKKKKQPAGRVFNFTTLSCTSQNNIMHGLYACCIENTPLVFNNSQCTVCMS